MSQQPVVDLDAVDPRSVLPRLPVSKRLHEVCESVLGEGRPVGWGAIPRYLKAGSNPPTYVQHTAPYAILYPLWADTSGDWQFPDAEAVWNYQITMVAKGGDQIEWMRDRLVKGLFGRTSAGAYVATLDVPGIRIMGREKRDDVGVAPDNASGSTGVVPADLRFRLYATRGDADS